MLDTPGIGGKGAVFDRIGGKLVEHQRRPIQRMLAAHHRRALYLEARPAARQKTLMRLDAWLRYQASQVRGSGRRAFGSRSCGGSGHARWPGRESGRSGFCPSPPCWPRSAWSCAPCFGDGKQVLDSMAHFAWSAFPVRPSAACRRCSVRSIFNAMPTKEASSVAIRASSLAEMAFAPRDDPERSHRLGAVEVQAAPATLRALRYARPISSHRNVRDAATGPARSGRA